MDRLTFDGNFCDIAMCREQKCPYDGSCSQREVWERLKAYEDTGLEPEEIEKAMAISALREQEERENPKPLTLDELREMDGEPVWLMADNKYYIVNNDFRLPWGERKPCGVDMWGAGTSLSLLAKCGLYRHNPKDV